MRRGDYDLVLTATVLWLALLAATASGALAQDSVGEVIKHTATHADIKRVTPYDFVAITDHAECYGVLEKLVDPDDA